VLQSTRFASGELCIHVLTNTFAISSSIGRVDEREDRFALKLLPLAALSANAAVEPVAEVRARRGPRERSLVMV